VTQRDFTKVARRERSNAEKLHYYLAESAMTHFAYSKVLHVKRDTSHTLFLERSLSRPAGPKG